MGLFAFRRAQRREVAISAASIPVSKPKKKRKPKAKVLTNGDHDSSHGGERIGQQLFDVS